MRSAFLPFASLCAVISKKVANLKRRGVLVGVQVSPTSVERRVHYCPSLNLFVVYRRRAAKWYPILWYPYGVRSASELCARGGPPSCERDTCCYITSPIVVAAQPRRSAESGRFRLVRDEHGDMGSSNRAPLDTPRPGPRFNRVWSPPLSRWLACKHIILASTRILRLGDNSNRTLEDEYVVYNEYVQEYIEHFFGA